MTLEEAATDLWQAEQPRAFCGVADERRACLEAHGARLDLRDLLEGLEGKHVRVTVEVLREPPPAKGECRTIRLIR
jgi:hypothetical protein